jgi:hypothetical protein
MGVLLKREELPTMFTIFSKKSSGLKRGSKCELPPAWVAAIGLVSTTKPSASGRSASDTTTSLSSFSFLFRDLFFLGET